MISIASTCKPIAMAVFILEDGLSVWMNLAKHLLFVWLFVSIIKKGTRRIISVWTNYFPENSSSRRIMHFVSVFILKTNNQTNNKYLPKFVQTDIAPSSIKRSFFLLSIQEAY